MVSPDRIKHFIFVRFFMKKFGSFSYDILDVDFLKERLIVAQNILRTLENQTCKNFELVFLANDNYFADEKYNFIFTALNNTSLPLVKIIKMKEVKSLLQDAYDNYDFVIQSRLDLMISCINTLSSKRKVKLTSATASCHTDIIEDTLIFTVSCIFGTIC